MRAKHTFIPEGLYQYLLCHSLREPAPLRGMRKRMVRHARSTMQSSPEVGQLLAFLVRASGARRCIEVGTFVGYSATWMALALPASGRIVCCDVSEEWTRLAKALWRRAGVERKCKLHLAPALETLDRLIGEGEAGGFDLAYIDADKGNYAGYYERCLKLLRAGGVIAVDNTLWKGQVANQRDQTNITRAIRAFNRKLHRDNRIELCLLSIGDGLTLAMKR